MNADLDSVRLQRDDAIGGFVIDERAVRENANGEVALARSVGDGEEIG